VRRPWQSVDGEDAVAVLDVTTDVQEAAGEEDGEERRMVAGWVEIRGAGVERHVVHQRA
jgi:hypothetical protein